MSDALRVLIADDDKTSLLLLETLLKRQGYSVVATENGCEAVEAFQAQMPDLVLLDVSMPQMDGYEAARRIKAMAGEVFVPIVFLTALTDEEDLVRCISAGGDDFLTKPYSRTILQAKIDALLRMRQLHSTIRSQRDELAEHQQRQQEEQVLARSIVENMLRRWPADLSNVRYLLRPSSLFNGDVIFIARGPTGSINVMLGDFTGHGLSAAVGSIPAAGVFYAMTAKGYGLKDIVEGVNRKLHELLPTHIFCAAGFATLDPARGTLALWNGGLPDVIVVNSAGDVIHRCESRNMPLGIVEPRSLQVSLDFVEVNPNDRVVLYSDGLMEMSTGKGMLGSDRVEALLREGGARGFDRVAETVQTLVETHGQRDDLALLELRCVNPPTPAPQKAGRRSTPANGEWRMLMEIGAPLLHDMDLLPIVLKAMESIRGLNEHCGSIGSIVSELYNNAVEHGLLGLDSSVKRSSDGFARYYALREQVLEEISEGRIVIDCRHVPEPGGGCLVVSIEDSGPGFDVDAVMNGNPKDSDLHGRGLKLVQSMAESLTFDEEGSRAEVVFRWRSGS